MSCCHFIFATKKVGDTNHFILFAFSSLAYTQAHLKTRHSFMLMETNWRARTLTREWMCYTRQFATTVTGILMGLRWSLLHSSFFSISGRGSTLFSTGGAIFAGRVEKWMGFSFLYMSFDSWYCSVIAENAKLTALWCWILVHSVLFSIWLYN